MRTALGLTMLVCGTLGLVCLLLALLGAFTGHRDGNALVIAASFLMAFGMIAGMIGARF